MIAWLERAWDRAWFAPATARSMRACRIIVAGHALWVVLSKPDIPSLVTWPDAFFTSVPRSELIRFGIMRGHPTLEWILFALLHVALIAAVFGIATRVACAVAGLLLYHFAPFEEIIIGMPHTHFAGLTVPTLGLLILAFAERPAQDSDAQSSEFRWPVTLVQLIFAFTYLFAFTGKLRFSGIRWFTGTTIRAQILGDWGVSPSPLGMAVASRPFLCWSLAIGTLLFESLFWVCVFWAPARRLFVPLAILFHLGILLTMNVYFASAPLLLLFVNWDWIVERVRRSTVGEYGSAAVQPQHPG